jgi:NADH-quinone oxidoreductase subunit A
MLLIYTNIVSLYQYLKLFAFIIVCFLIVFLIPFVTYLVSPNSRNAEKLSSYECGFEPFDDSRGTFDIHFFIIAILFIIFDLEIAFIFPWAKLLYFLGAFGF